MNKKVWLILIIGLSLILLASCENDTRLKAPHHLNLSDNGILSWEFESGSRFGILVDDVEHETKAPQFNLGLLPLEAGTYEVRVRVLSSTDDIKNSVYSTVIKYTVKEGQWLINAIYEYYYKNNWGDNESALTEAIYAAEQLNQFNEYLGFSQEQLFYFFIYMSNNDVVIEEIKISSLSLAFIEMDWTPEITSKVIFSYYLLYLKFQISELNLYFGERDRILKALEDLGINLVKLENDYLLALSKIENSHYYYLVNEIELIQNINDSYYQDAIRYHEYNLKDVIADYDYMFKIWQYEAALKAQRTDEVLTLETIYPWFIDIRDLFYARVENQNKISDYKNELETQPKSDSDNYNQYLEAKRQYFGELEEIEDKINELERQLNHWEQVIETVSNEKNRLDAQLEYFLANQDQIVKLINIHVLNLQFLKTGQFCNLLTFVLEDVLSVSKDEFDHLLEVLKVLLAYEIPTYQNVKEYVELFITYLQNIYPSLNLIINEFLDVISIEERNLLINGSFEEVKLLFQEIIERLESNEHVLENIIIIQEQFSLLLDDIDLDSLTSFFASKLNVSIPLMRFVVEAIFNDPIYLLSIQSQLFKFLIEIIPSLLTGDISYFYQHTFDWTILKNITSQKIEDNLIDFKDFFIKNYDLLSKKYPNDYKIDLTKLDELLDINLMSEIIIQTKDIINIVVDAYYNFEFIEDDTLLILMALNELNKEENKVLISELFTLLKQLLIGNQIVDEMGIEITTEGLIKLELDFYYILEVINQIIREWPIYSINSFVLEDFQLDPKLIIGFVG